MDRSTPLAAVVGVIANLALWFAHHVLFTRVGEARLGPLTLTAPEWTTLDWRAALLTALALLLTFALKWGVVRVLAVCALGGFAFALL